MTLCNSVGQWKWRNKTLTNFHELAMAKFGGFENTLYICSVIMKLFAATKKLMI